MGRAQITEIPNAKPAKGNWRELTPWPLRSERGESVIFDGGFLILPAVAAPTPAPTLVGAGRGRDTVRVNEVLKLEA